MVRASAKNFESVCTIVHPEDYQQLIEELNAHGGTRLEFRQNCAMRAFRHTALYDAQIAQEFEVAVLGSIDLDVGCRKCHRPSVWREPTPACMAAAKPTGRWLGSGKTTSGKGALLQQHARCRCSLSKLCGHIDGRWRKTCRHHHQTPQSLWSCSGQQPARSPCVGLGRRSSLGLWIDHLLQPSCGQ